MTAPWPAADEEQAAVTELVDRIVADTPDDGDDVPLRARRARALLVQQGLFSLAMPDAVGGGGAGLPVLVALLERLGRSRPALGLACAHAHAAVHVLAAQPGRLPQAGDVAAGAPIALVDAAAVHLDAESGVLSGEPVRVDAGAPEPALLLVEPDGAAGLCVVVAAGSASVSVGPPLRRTGLAGAATRWISFPGTSPLEPGAAADQRPGRAGLALLHLQVAALACGVAAGALDAAATYVREREQFGSALAELPTVQAAVFDAHAALRGVQHQVAVIAAVGDAVDSVAAAVALRSATEMAVQVATTGVQLHGGYGYLTDYPAERYLRDAVSLRAAAATTAVARGAAARLLTAAI